MISGSSAGLTLFAFINQWWLPSSHHWVILFVAEVLLYGVVFKLTNDEYSATQFSEPL
jgi:hypothetical protein|tara:strand:- start:396 stop:569 length:174 start_codon:yes stop_codon:yes gene_type:complete